MARDFCLPSRPCPLEYRPPALQFHNTTLYVLIQSTQLWGISIRCLSSDLDMYLLTMTILASVILYGKKNLEYIDALFFASGAATQSGLNTYVYGRVVIASPH